MDNKKEFLFAHTLTTNSSSQLLLAPECIFDFFDQEPILNSQILTIETDEFESTEMKPISFQGQLSWKYPNGYSLAIDLKKNKGYSL